MDAIRSVRHTRRVIFDLTIKAITSIYITRKTIQKSQTSELHKSHGKSLKSLNYINHMEQVSKV
mgnify:FL=1